MALAETAIAAPPRTTLTTHEIAAILGEFEERAESMAGHAQSEALMFRSIAAAGQLQMLAQMRAAFRALVTGEA